MVIRFFNPLYEYAYAHNPSGWRGLWGGKYFWKYAFPDLRGRWFGFKLRIILPGFFLDIW